MRKRKGYIMVPVGLVIAGLALLALAFGGKSNASEQPTSSKPDGGSTSSPSASTENGKIKLGDLIDLLAARWSDLANRAAQGAALRDQFRAALDQLLGPVVIDGSTYKGRFQGHNLSSQWRDSIANGLARWAGIENGGKLITGSNSERGPLANTDGERKLGQVTDEQWAGMLTSTDPSLQAKWAASCFLGLASLLPDNWDMENPRDVLYYAKLVHGLPLYAKELKDAGDLGTETPLAAGEVLPYAQLVPSPTLGAWGDCSKVTTLAKLPNGARMRGSLGLLLRFAVTALVVATGSSTMTFDKSSIPSALLDRDVTIK